MHAFVLYGVIIALTLLVPVNPLVAYWLTGARSFALYAGFVDLCLLILAGAGVLYLRTGRRVFLAGFAIVLAGFVPALILAEAGWVYVRQRFADRLLGEVAEIHEEHPLLVYTLMPEAQGRHTSLGNFDVEYVIDARGRKRIAQSPEAARTIHVFGDSFTFGYGVANADTWLNRLSARLGDDVNILNYGVMGYSLEQMLLGLERYADEIAPGDLVLFTPIAADLERSLVGKTYVCAGLIRAEQNTTFPKWQDGAWRPADLREECNFFFDTLLANSPFPVSFGALYRQIRHTRRHDRMIENADRIFAAARRIAREQGADFHVVFLATPEECANGRFSIDIASLETPFSSLLPHCPEDAGAAAALKFPYDGHWSPAGHAWAAEALQRVLDELAGTRAGRAG